MSLTAAALAAPIQDPPSQPGGLPAGVTRDQMWPAPTEADWKLPCLIHWQRNWDDAVAISRQTKQPISKRIFPSINFLEGEFFFPKAIFRRRDERTRLFVQQTDPRKAKLPELHSHLTNGVEQFLPVITAHDRLIDLTQRGIQPRKIMDLQVGFFRFCDIAARSYA